MCIGIIFYDPIWSIMRLGDLANKVWYILTSRGKQGHELLLLSETKIITRRWLEPAIVSLNETCSIFFLRFLLCFSKFEVFALFFQLEGYPTSLKHFFLEYLDLSHYMHFYLFIHPYWFLFGCFPADSLVWLLKGLTTKVVVFVEWSRPIEAMANCFYYLVTKSYVLLIEGKRFHV
jgi:hypothetical protein